MDARALNRATLARQLLLDRSDMPARDAVAHLCGMQAQEPQEPFVGLWSRVGNFEPAELDELMEQRKVVRTHLMRRTVHLLTAEDVLAWRARHNAMLRQRVLGTYRRELNGVDLQELEQAGLKVMADGEARSMAELVGLLAERWPEPPSRALGEMLIAALIPVAQVPPRGLWRTKAGVRNVLLEAWLGREIETAENGKLIKRYLAAFGPAAVADIRAWSGLAGLPDEVAALKDELVSVKDDRGRKLIDLPDAPRPDPDTPAPTRFLPAFDNAILGYDDRSRIIDDEHRLLSVAGERVVLVDGRVTATWNVDNDTVIVNPLRRLNKTEHTAVIEEGQHMALFLSDNECDRVQVRK